MIVCMDCGGEVKRYDTVTRKVKIEYGRCLYVKIDRYRCVRCRRIHRNIPDSIMKYKQYRADIIKSAINGDKLFERLEFEDYPTELTVKRWIKENKES